jgi:hypothetical protein
MSTIQLEKLNTILQDSLRKIKMKFHLILRRQFIHVRNKWLKYTNKLLMIKELLIMIRLTKNHRKKNSWPINSLKI